MKNKLKPAKFKARRNETGVQAAARAGRAIEKANGLAPGALDAPSAAAESLIVARSKIMPSPTNPRKSFPQ
jgi:hypothetical protein